MPIATNLNKTNIGVTILGATGSIGISTLDVIEQHGDKFNVFALTANTRVDRMIELCKRHKPEFAVMQQADAAEQLKEKLTRQGIHDIEVLAGEAGLIEVAQHAQVDYVMAAIVGAAGLKPTLAAANSGKRILLANKEALVMSGKLFMDAVAKSGARLLPIDSEHNAIFQCMPPQFEEGLTNAGVVRILLTASGGPFRDMPLSQIDSVTPEQAVAHPNWSMGKKISVDSATMMNKGLEIIEACWLFDTVPEFIQVVIHPQSVIHSLVEYVDGSVIAQLGNPDMRTPIAHALAWPDRISSGVKPLDLFDIGKLDFSKPDYQRFPCLKLCLQAMQQGGLAPTVLNAANEVAVDAFLNRKIPFNMIANIIDSALSDVTVPTGADDLASILQVDQNTRALACSYVERYQSKNHYMN